MTRIQDWTVPSLRPLVGVVALVLVCLGIAAQGVYASRDTRIEELLKLSGIDRQLAQLPSLMQYQVSRQQKNVPPELHEPMGKALLEAYDPAALLSTVRLLARDTYDEKKIDEALAWLKGPVGLRMTRSEVEATSVEGQKAKAAYLKTWETNPPPQERIQLMVRFNEATHATELSIQMVVASFDGMMRGMMAMVPEEQRIPESKLAEIKNNMVQQLAQPLLNQNIAGFMYTYREIGTADMENAIAFYRSEAGVWYQDLMVNGLLKGMEAGGVHFGQKMESIMNSAPRKS